MCVNAIDNQIFIYIYIYDKMFLESIACKFTCFCIFMFSYDKKYVTYFVAIENQISLYIFM